MERLDALYARQSLDKKESISIESQLAFCKCETHGNVFQTYIDRGFSGKNTNRPAFEQMIEDIRAGKIRRVIVYKLDRISRSILDFSNMMELFQEYGVEFISSTEKFDTSTPIGRAMLNICIVFAQLERETIQMRVSDAYCTRSQKGYYMGGRVPYGFKLEKTTQGNIHPSVFAPVETESSQIRLIYDLYSDPDMTLSGVLRALAERGITKKRGAPWCAARISEIIRNPVYVKADMDIYCYFQRQGANLINPASDFIGTNGIFLYQGDGDKHKKKRYDLAGRDVVIAPHQGIIESRTWLRCRLKISENRQSARTNKGSRSWLSGKIKCGKCGYAYVAAQSKSGRYFHCSGSRYSVKCRGCGQTIYADALEASIAHEIERELLNFSCLYGPTDDGMQEDPAINSSKIRLAGLSEEINSLLDKIPQAGNALMDYINRRVEELDLQRLALQKQLERQSAAQAFNPANPIAVHEGMWNLLSSDDKQRIADLLIDKIIIDEADLVVRWKL